LVIFGEKRIFQLNPFKTKPPPPEKKSILGVDGKK